MSTSLYRRVGRGAIVDGDAEGSLAARLVLAEKRINGGYWTYLAFTSWCLNISHIPLRSQRSKSQKSKSTTRSRSPCVSY